MVIGLLSLCVGSHTLSPSLGYFTWRPQARVDSALPRSLPVLLIFPPRYSAPLPPPQAARSGSPPFLSPGELLFWSQGSSAEQLIWPGLRRLGVISPFLAHATHPTHLHSFLGDDSLSLAFPLLEVASRKLLFYDLNIAFTYCNIDMHNFSTKGGGGQFHPLRGQSWV